MQLSSHGTFSIAADESQKFAMVSGDFNPLHLDPVLARRYQFGSTLIHGINGTLRALDMALVGKDKCALESININFNKPVRQGDTVELFCSDLSQTDIKLELHHRGKRSQSIRLVLARPHAATEMQANTLSTSETPAPDVLSIEDAVGQGASVDLVWDEARFCELFPQLRQTLPDQQCALLLGTTQIVGMKCPGLNSVFARFSARFIPSTEPCQHVEQLTYRVTEADARFGRALIHLQGPWGDGEIEAFFRPEPVRQASCSDIKQLVAPARFKDQRPCVIGGSRGLGEVIAKLLAAGGADVLVTYASGESDARRVAAEINKEGGRCSIAHCDVQSGAGCLPEHVGSGNFTHLYYLASPRIEKSDDGLWNQQAFERYISFYVEGLANLLTPLSSDPQYRSSRFTVFVPSTVFLETGEKGFAEYIAAKAASEAFAGALELRHRGWKAYTPRLPRLLTDQTSGVSTTSQIETARTILEFLPTAESDDATYG